MKKSVKILSLILTITMLVSLASSCGNNDNPESEKPSESVTVTEDIGTHYVSGMLHERNVKNSGREFVKSNKTADYSIVYDSSDSYAVMAAEFISNNVLSATGAKLSAASYNGQTYSENARFIVLNIGEMFDGAGLNMPQTELGSAGYYIKTAGNSVFIMSTGKEGLQMGAMS